MNNRFLILAFSVTLLLSCTPPEPPMYYWGNYSTTLYSYKKTPNDKILAAHKSELLRIITESQKRKLRVPPGVYCEYAYILAHEANQADALKYIELEAQTYPESRQFVDKLKAVISERKE